MLKSFRKALNDRIVYSLTGMDWKDRPAPKTDAESAAEADPLHGVFGPIFERWIAIERRSPNPLSTKIDEALYKAGALTPTNVSLLNLSVAVYSILLLLEAGAHVDTRALPAKLLESVEREWEYALKKNGTLPGKATLAEQIGSMAERHAFLAYNGTDVGPSEAGGLYYQRAKVVRFLTYRRSETFRGLLADDQQAEGAFLWQWAFGGAMRERLALVSNELVELAAVATEDTLHLYKIHLDPNPPEPEPQDIVRPCPSCNQRLRITLPPKASAGRCSACKEPFTIVTDQDGITLQSVPKPGRPNVDAASVQAALAVLGLSGNPSPTELRSAYRKRMSEYHPDKVASFGPKIRAVAAQEASAINDAMDTLTQAGLMDE